MGFAQDIVSDQVAPPFLQGPNGTAFLTAIGQSLDTLQVRSAQAAYIHMPGLGDPSGLPLIGLDRGMLQGPGETVPAFILRLRAAYDTWQRAGNDWTVLQEVLAQILPLTPPALIVSNSSTWSYYPAGASTAVPPLSFRALVPNWNWDGNVEPLGSNGVPWWRMWLVLFSYAPNAWATPAPVLGSGRILGANPGTTSIGFGNIGAAFWVTLRQIIRTFKAQQAWCRWIVVCFDSAHFLQDSPTAGGVNPDGTFGPSFQIVANCYVAPTRFTDSRYVDGVVA
jgi:hypothetical protein